MLCKPFCASLTDWIKVVILSNINYIAVCQLRKRLKEKMQQDAAVKKRDVEIEVLLKRQLSNVRGNRTSKMLVSNFEG